MTNFSQNNHQQVLVGKDVAKTTTSIAAIADGEIALFTPGGTMYTEATADAGDVFGIYLGRAAALGPLKSTYFSKADVTRVTKKAYAAPTAQLDYIGTNGTTGSIAVLNNTVYRATIETDKGRPETNIGGVYVKDMVYKSDAGATQSEIALGLTGSAYFNFSREAEETIAFAAICDNAGVANDSGTGAITATKGSKVISAATDIDDDMTAGDFIRFGTATTAPMYKLVSFDTTANTATLDRPYAEATQVWGTTATEWVSAALGAAANWGISLTAVTLSFNVGKMSDRISTWDLSLDSASFGATTLLNSTTAAPGTGTYRQVAELEWFANGNVGELFRNEAKDNFAFTAHANDAETYDVIEIEIDKGRNSLIATSNPQTISLFIDSGKDTSGHYALAATTDDITDMLEDLLIGVPVYGGAVTANGGALADGDLALT